MRLIVPSFFLLIAATFLPGCDRAAPDSYTHTYTTKGIVLSLPGERVTQEFIVHHEEIPEYISINGSIGMNEMAMPIPVRDKSVLEGIGVGDRIELVFGERFEPDHTMGLISVTKLSEDVELNLGQTTRGSEDAREPQ